MTKKSTSRAAKRETSELEPLLAWLQRTGSKKNRDGMARYGIVAAQVYGVSVGALRERAKRVGTNHALALALWKTGAYEARMLAAFVDDPALVSASQMKRWSADFDNWAICDTVCFHLFDKTPHAWAKIDEWADDEHEFVKRAAFALLASLTVHDKSAPDERYLEGLRRIERAADDPRNFVKKAVNWALRSIGKRNLALHEAALNLAKTLAVRSDAAARWIGKDAARELSSPAVLRRLEARAGKLAKKR